VTVATHQRVAMFVDQLGQGGRVHVDLGLQRHRQHAAGAFAGQLVQAHRHLGPGGLVCDYTQPVAALLPPGGGTPESFQHGQGGTYAARSCHGLSTDFDDISGVPAARVTPTLKPR
jgi:hypothetical protein